jgi:hypothetical protein
MQARKFLLLPSSSESCGRRALKVDLEQYH